MAEIGLHGEGLEEKLAERVGPVVELGDEPDRISRPRRLVRISSASAMLRAWADVCGHHVIWRPENLPYSLFSYGAKL
ncbi:hypothetical protein [Nocardia carnea]|uniref:hypothetical protein n=1 Tax=Nocardia carnea TaxID=37328 RepID=UPI00245732BE|nr:hypothetical protein [Nocardia carnea]